MKIPALDRGIRILDFLIRSVVPRRYSDIRQEFDPISDASLNRLLKTLINCNYIEKDVNGHYCVTEAVCEWKKYLGGGLPTKDIIAPIIEQLAHELNESAAFAVLNKDRIEVLCCANVVDSFSIVHAGSFLNFEDDHAAVMAILDAVASEKRLELIDSPYSTIETITSFREAIDTVKRNGFYSDKPLSRLGMNRLAVPVSRGETVGALFICAPTERKEKFMEQYVATLQRYKGEILRRL